MTRPRKLKTEPIAPAPPPKPPVYPAWYVRDPPYHRLAHGRSTPGYLTRRVLTVPRFQRLVVWTPAQQVAYVQALFDGLVSTSPIVIWERRFKHLVIDGLQRLTALDLPMVRDDGEEHPRSYMAVDCYTGRALVARDPEFPVIPIRRFTVDRMESYWMLRALGDEAFDAAMAAEKTFERIELTYTVLEGSAAVAFQVMRGINQPGVRFDLDELAANLRACEQEYQ